MDRVAIIPCTNQKSTVPGPAREVWQGANFQLTLYHAEKYYDRVFIMSYKYGLIEPDTLIEPYDIDLKTASAAERLEWWWTVREHIKKLAEEHPDLIAVYTGKFERNRFLREFVRNGYRRLIIPWESDAIGQRMQKIYDDIPPYDMEEVTAGKYDLPESFAEPKKRGRPKKKKEEDSPDMDWED